MRIRAAAALSTIALLGGACGGGGGAPADKLESALADLRGSDFSYEITLDVDNDVLSQAAASDPTIGQASLFAGSFAMRGTYSGDDSSFSVAVMGQDVFGMRLLDDSSKVYLQLGLVDLLEGFGMSREDILSQAQAQGVPAGYEGLLDAVFSGEWIGFENDQEAFEAAVDDEYRAEYGDPAQMREAFAPLVERFSDPSAFLEEYGTVTASDEVDGLEVLAVDLRLRSLLGDLARDFAKAVEGQEGAPFADLGADLEDLEAELEEGLAEVPESVGGLTVGLRDGKVERITFDLGAAAASIGEDGIAPGAAMLLVTISRDGVAAVTAPETGEFFTSDQLVELLRKAGGPTA